MSSFMTCMEVVLEINPEHVWKNMKLIAKYTSVKIMFMLVKHVQNPDRESPNNFWGFLDIMGNRGKYQQSFHPEIIMDKYLACKDERERENLLGKAQIATNEAKRRRMQRFDGKLFTTKVGTVFFIVSKHEQKM